MKKSKLTEEQIADARQVENRSVADASLEDLPSAVYGRAGRATTSCVRRYFTKRGTPASALVNANTPRSCALTLRIARGSRRYARKTVRARVGHIGRTTAQPRPDRIEPLGRDSVLTPEVRPKNSLMHVGGDYHSIAGRDITSKQNLEYNLRHGVRHLTAQLRKQPRDGWNPEVLKQTRDNCDEYGVVLEAIRMDLDYIRMRKGPERDREIDTIVENIRKAAQVGVSIITYNWEVIPYRRNAKTPGRGGSVYDSFKLENDWRSLPPGDAGRVTHEDYCERIVYFLDKVIPAAKEHDVRLACHPYDPPGLPFGYQGVDQWDSSGIFDAQELVRATGWRFESSLPHQRHRARKDGLSFTFALLLCAIASGARGVMKCDGSATLRERDRPHPWQ
jgi:D-mannonate dehydratase (UxuA)